MARTIEEIQGSIITQVNNTPELSTPSTSKYAIWRLWAYIVASAIQLLEELFDTHKAEVSKDLAALKSHTRLWYQSKSLAYQHGASLPDGEDTYDNTGLSDTAIDTMKIIKRAAVVELANKLQIKVAKEVSGLSVPLSNLEKVAFTEYINDVKDAGISIEIISVEGDKLIIFMDVYYDSKVLNSNGERLDGSSATPVQDTIELFLKQLPFNGVLILSDLIDAIQKTPGVVSPIIRDCKASYVLSPLVYFTVDSYWTTYAGHFQLEGLNVNFIEYNL